MGLYVYGGSVQCLVAGTRAPTYTERYDQFRDDSASWTFDTAEYHSDLDTLTNGPPQARPRSRQGVPCGHLEGYVQEQRAESAWTDNALDSFDAFSSTTQVEAVARALWEIADRIER